MSNNIRIIDYDTFSGYPPIINRNGSLPGGLIRVGTPICLDYKTIDPFKVGVVCAPLPGAVPEPAAIYTFSVDTYYFDINQFQDEDGDKNLVYVYTGDIKMANEVGSFTCNNSNRFGFDIETTVIQRSEHYKQLYY